MKHPLIDPMLKRGFLLSTSFERLQDKSNPNYKGYREQILKPGDLQFAAMGDRFKFHPKGPNVIVWCFKI